MGRKGKAMPVDYWLGWFVGMGSGLIVGLGVAWAWTKGRTYDDGYDHGYDEGHQDGYAEASDVYEHVERFLAHKGNWR